VILRVSESGGSGNVEEKQTIGKDPPEDLLASVQLADAELGEIHQGREQDPEK
jgi:hypothetical protein